MIQFDNSFMEFERARFLPWTCFIDSKEKQYRIDVYTILSRFWGKKQSEFDMQPQNGKLAVKNMSILSAKSGL